MNRAPASLWAGALSPAKCRVSKSPKRLSTRHPPAWRRPSVILLINMPTSELISVSEYLHTSYSPDCDYVDGLVMERNVGEWDHADLQGAFVTYFRTRRKQWNIQAVPECRVQVAPTRFRI